MRSGCLGRFDRDAKVFCHSVTSCHVIFTPLTFPKLKQPFR